MTDQREESQPVTPGGPAPTRIREGAELPAPPGMHPMGQLDARFPVAYEGSGRSVKPVASSRRPRGSGATAWARERRMANCDNRAGWPRV